MQEKNKLNLNERPLGKKVNLKIEPCDMGTFFYRNKSNFLALSQPKSVQIIMLIQKTTRHSSDLYALVYFV